jgi:protein-S-isoprenylcysteine O-methyltransferase Ste14
MEFFTKLLLGWLNGWMPLAIFYFPFALLMRIFPREVVRRLYAGSDTSTEQRLLNAQGSLFDLTAIVLLIFSPLKIGHVVFLPGITLYVLGTAGFLWALFDFKDTPLDEPVTKGIYRFSRNPRWVMMAVMLLSIGIIVGSGIILLLFGLRIVCNHFRMVGEEKYCLARYGEAYRKYMEHVPRYLLFF